MHCFRDDVPVPNILSNLADKAVVSGLYRSEASQVVAVYKMIGQHSARWVNRPSATRR